MHKMILTGTLGLSILLPGIAKGNPNYGFHRCRNEALSLEPLQRIRLSTPGGVPDVPLHHPIPNGSPCGSFATGGMGRVSTTLSTLTRPRGVGNRNL